MPIPKIIPSPDHLTAAECRRYSPRMWRDRPKRQSVIRRATRKAAPAMQPGIAAAVLYVAATVVIVIKLIDSASIPDYTAPQPNVSWGVRGEDGKTYLHNGVEWQPARPECSRGFAS